MDYEIIDRHETVLTVRVRIPAADLESLSREAEERRGERGGRETARAMLINGAIEEILRREAVAPVAAPEVAVPEPAAGQDLLCTLRFETLSPRIVLPEDPSALTVPVPAPERAYAEALSLLLRMRRSRARFTEVRKRRLPRDGDVLELDIDAFLDGAPLPALGRQGFKMKLAPPADKPDAAGPGDELETLARSLYPGEHGETTSPCPPDHPDPTCRGRRVRLRVRLRRILIEDLPEADDAFAKGFGFRSFADLWRTVLSRASGETFQAMRGEGQIRLLDSLLEGQDFETPAAVLTSFREECARESPGLGQDEIARRAKAHCFLLAFARKFGIGVDQDTLNRELDEIARQSGGPREHVAARLRETGGMERLMQRLEANAALSALYDRAKKTVVDAAGVPVPPPQ